VAASQVLITLPFGVSRLDPVTYLGVIALLAGVSGMACGVPAWRAAQVDPGGNVAGRIAETSEESRTGFPQAPRIISGMQLVPRLPGPLERRWAPRSRREAAND